MALTSPAHAPLPARERQRIDAAELLSVRPSEDGARLSLVLRDAAGVSITLSLPCACLNALLASMPQDVDSGAVHQLDSWRVVPSENGRDLLLTLRTAEGRAVSFATRPWQIQGMATIAAYSGVAGAAPKLRH